MEFGFNLAWLILSLALSVVWAWTANRTPHHHAHRASFLALVVLISLLFPVVSISDDLHDQANSTSEEPRYVDDLHRHFERARLQVDHDPLALDRALLFVVPALRVAHFEEVRGFIFAPMLSPRGFPPAVHDLPPPVQA